MFNMDGRTAYYMVRTENYALPGRLMYPVVYPLPGLQDKDRIISNTSKNMV
jgi:hypothetical protein